MDYSVEEIIKRTDETIQSTQETLKQCDQMQFRLLKIECQMWQNKRKMQQLYEQIRLPTYMLTLCLYMHEYWTKDSWYVVKYFKTLRKMKLSHHLTNRKHQRQRREMTQKQRIMSFVSNSNEQYDISLMEEIIDIDETQNKNDEDDDDDDDQNAEEYSLLFHYQVQIQAIRKFLFRFKLHYVESPVWKLIYRNEWFHSDLSLLERKDL